jgi:hypothetical protein
MVIAGSWQYLQRVQAAAWPLSTRLAGKTAKAKQGSEADDPFN